MFYLIVLRCSYVGLNYHGFQVQPDVPTVQGEIRKALSNLGLGLSFRYCSRTDAGVSAVDQLLVINSDDPNVGVMLNDELPEDVRIHAYFLTDRFDFGDVLYKEYLYVAPKFLVNLNKINDAIEYMSGARLNYLHLIKKPSQVDLKDVLMRIYVRVSLEKDNLLFRVKGKKFHWEQVRRIVNLLVAVGLGRVSLETFKEILHGKPYKSGIPPAPPEGLILWRIYTRHDDKFVEMYERRKIEEWIMRNVKKAIISAKWVLPSKEKTLYGI